MILQTFLHATDFWRATELAKTRDNLTFPSAPPFPPPHRNPTIPHPTPPSHRRQARSNPTSSTPSSTPPSPPNKHGFCQLASARYRRASSKACLQTTSLSATPRSPCQSAHHLLATPWRRRRGSAYVRTYVRTYVLTLIFLGLLSTGGFTLYPSPKHIGRRPTPWRQRGPRPGPKPGR